MFVINIHDLSGDILDVTDSKSSSSLNDVRSFFSKKDLIEIINDVC